jgi:hypothetical protein
MEPQYISLVVDVATYEVIRKLLEQRENNKRRIREKYHERRNQQIPTKPQQYIQVQPVFAESSPAPNVLTMPL